MYVVALMVGCSRQVVTVGVGDTVFDVPTEEWRRIKSVNGYGFVTLSGEAGESTRHCNQIRGHGGY